MAASPALRRSGRFGVLLLALATAAAAILADYLACKALIGI
jgi:hypothetical protein